jgi:hypothetical protein
MFQPDISGSSGPLWLGDWKYMYQIGQNVWEWSDFLGVGMDFQAKEWSFLFRNGLHHYRYAY